MTDFSDTAHEPFDPGTWLELVRDDRNAAFTMLANRYRQEIFDLCVRVGGSRSEAEDLTQETFIRAYEKLGGFRGQAHPRTWLYRIAINLSISFTRRMRRWRMRRTDDSGEWPAFPDISEASAEQNVEWGDMARRAHICLQRLPVRQRTAVVLRVVKEMSYEEVAEVMGLSLGGAKSNVHQGLKKMRAMLEDE